MKTCPFILALAFGVVPEPAGATRPPAPDIFTGVADASAVEELDGGWLAVAGDEDNIIHLYRHGWGSAPAYRLDLADFLRVTRKAKEADLEGAARIGDRIYWITSHGRDAKGRPSPSRQRFFATTATASNGFAAFRPIGRPYTGLVGDLLRDPRLQQFRMKTAAALAPKTPGALNIEGLAATPEGHLLIGFRSPVPWGKTLLVPLLNPAEVIEGVPARLGDPILLDLGWLGIRSITSKDGRYWIIAGPSSGNGISRLFVWDGRATRPDPVPNTQLVGLNPEAIVLHHSGEGERLFVASDDGNLKLGSTPLKKLKEPSLQRFRAIWIEPLPGGVHQPTPREPPQTNQAMNASRNLLQSSRRTLFAVCAGALCLATATAPAQVVINEILADNEGAVENAGDQPDFVELFNTGAAPVDLAGMSLTDDPTLPRRFMFSSGTVIPAGGFLLVWCDVEYTKPGLHAGFALSSTGERIRLYAPDGITVLSEVVFGLQAPDLSISRVPDGGNAWRLTPPTALAANAPAVTLATPAQLRLNEWMARPAVGDDWIEVFNGSAQPVLLAGLVLTDTYGEMPLNRAIPYLSFIGGREYVIFQATDLEKPDADHLDFKISGSGEVLSLYHSNRTTIIDRVSFGSQTTDVSQGRAPDGSDHIVFFPAGQSSPGAPNFTPLTNIVISEVLSHNDPPLEDAIELQNVTAAPVDISHWWLSDSASNPQKYRIPPDTVIPGGGFKVFYQYQFDAGTNAFRLSAAKGDQIFLSAGDSSGVLTGPQTSLLFGPLKNGVSIGRHRTSVGVDFVPLSGRTFGVDAPTSLAEFRQGAGKSNAPPRVGPVVMSELMFCPLGANVGDEYIELHNPTSFQVPLFDPDYPANRWKIAGGVTFEFPPNIVLPPGGCLLVVSFNPAAVPEKLTAFRATYGLSTNVPVFGPYDDSLSDVGEAIQLLWPDQPELDPDTGLTIVPYELLEEIHYSTSAPWPVGAVANGYSLQRRASLDYGNEPLHWFTGAPTPGRGSLADADGDGMSDEWESTHDLDPNWSGDAELDPDQDGAVNCDEYVAGTHPRNPESVLKILQVIRQANVLRLSFDGVAGRSYEVQASADVVSGDWTTVTNLPALAESGSIAIEVPIAASSLGCFRLVAASE